MQQTFNSPFSIGGDNNITNVTTLPSRFVHNFENCTLEFLIFSFISLLVLLWSDILKEFNPSVTGFSKGICKETSPDAFLNQAVSGATAGSVVFTASTLSAANL